MTCLVLSPTCLSAVRTRSSLDRPRTSQRESVCSAIHGQMECHINLNSPPSFGAAANRPDHSLHGLNRPLDNSVALRAANGAVLNDHPRSACHRPHSTPRSNQTRQRGFIVRLHNNFTKPRHQSSTYPFSRRLPRKHCTDLVSLTLATKKGNVFPSFSSPMNM